MMLVGTAIESLLSALGVAVLHFIWQGAAIGLIAAIVLGALPNRSPLVRYWVACIALAGCLVTFLSTFVAAIVPSVLGASEVKAVPIELASALASSTGSHGAWLLDGVAWVWLGGVVFFGVRFALQWLSAHRLKTTGVCPPDAHWQGIFDEIKDRLGIVHSVRLVQSSLAQSPMVVGWLAPVVLVPASAFVSLTPEQLRAVLVHELAHIRRHDHLVNAAQVVIETLLFFHPVVWWLSKRARVEREHCCDDAAVRTAAHPRVFAEALARLESLRNTHPHAALAANGGPLMNRIARILNTDGQGRNRTPKWRTVIAVAAGTIVAAGGIAHATSVTNEAGDDEILQVLRQAADAGTPLDQLRDVYNATVYPTSKLRAQNDKKLEMVFKDIDAAVEHGKLSTAEAHEKRDAIRAEMNRWQRMAFSMEVLGLTEGEAYVEFTRGKLERMVRNNALEQAQAERELADLQRSVDVRQEYAEHVEKMTVRIREAVASGEITEGEAKQKMERVERMVKARMHVVDAEKKIDAAVRAGKLTRAEAAEKIELVRRRAERVHAEHHHDVDWDAIKERIEGAVERGDMTREEADRAYRGIRERIHRAHDRHDANLRRVAGALSEMGVEDDKIRNVIRGMHRIIHSIHEQGEDFEVGERMRVFLSEQGLTDDQIGRVVGMSRRLAAQREHDRERGHDHDWRRVAGALSEMGVEEGSVRNVIDGMKRVVHAMREQGEAFELNARVRTYFEEQGLTEAQIDRVVRMSRRLSSHR